MPKTAEKPERTLLKKIRAIADQAEKRWVDDKMPDQFKKVRQLYHGKWKKEATESNMIVHVNLLYPIVKVGAAGMSVKVPEVKATPRKADPGKDDYAKADRMAAALNYSTKVMRYPQENRLALLHALSYPYAVWKFGVDKETGLVWWMACEPENVRVYNQDTWAPLEGRWIQHKFNKYVAEMRATGLYKDKTLDSVMDKEKKRGEEKYEDTVKVELKESQYLDGKTMRLVTETPGMDDPLRVEDEMETYGCGFSYRFLHLSDALEGHFPVAEPLLFYEQNIEINHLRTKGLLTASRANVKILLAEERFPNDDEVAKLESNEPMAIARCKGPTTQGAMDVVNPAQLNTDIFQRQEINGRDDAALISGTTGDGRELPQAGSRPANVIAFQQQNLLVRQGEREVRVTEVMTDLYECTGKILQKTLKGKILSKVAGGPLASIEKSGIQGDFDYKLDVYNALSSDPVLMREDAEKIFDKLAGLDNVDHDYRVEQFLKQMGRNDAEFYMLKKPKKEEPPPAPSPDANILNTLVPPPGVPAPLPTAIPPSPLVVPPEGGMPPVLPPIM